MNNKKSHFYLIHKPVDYILIYNPLAYELNEINSVTKRFISFLITEAFSVILNTVTLKSVNDMTAWTISTF